MLFAKTAQGERIEPAPGGRAACAQCGGEVLAKCGRLVSWHWAHRAAECDSWSEGETEWHLGWKRAVSPDACEVVIGEHRADIRTAEGIVIELQHSPIDTDTILTREQHYGTMRWLFDARAFDLSLMPNDARVPFVWQRPRRSLLSVNAPMFWDLGAGFVLRVESLSEHSPLGGFAGHGVLLDSACFASQLFGRSAREPIHQAARSRGQRVRHCLLQARKQLRAQPGDGPDGAFRAALMREDLSDLAAPWLGPVAAK